ncbi:hypothetical protein X975_03226, partial [Stegodyphus mimosarum]
MQKVKFFQSINVVGILLISSIFFIYLAFNPLEIFRAFFTCMQIML